MGTPCDGGEGPRWPRRAHPFPGHFTGTPHFSVLGWQGATTKYMFSSGIVIVFLKLFRSASASHCMFTSRIWLALSNIFNSNN